MLKKSISFLIVLICCTVFVQAQAVLQTKSAKIKFFSSTSVEDIEAVNNQGISKLDPATGQLIFQLLIKGFVFENELMQKHFNEEYLESGKFPKSEYKGLIINIKSINFSKAGAYTASSEGMITIHGISKKVKANGTITVANGKASLKSVFKIKVKDFGINGDEIGKTISNELEITVTCQY
jgi:hypothetical protein